MFKFNFNCDADGESISPQPEKSGLDDKIHAESAKLEESVKESNVVSKYDECKEITPTDQQLDTDYSCPPFELNALTLKNGEKINYVSIGDIISELIENADEITCAENSHSDLVAGIYEGTEFVCWTTFVVITHQGTMEGLKPFFRMLFLF